LPAPSAAPKIAVIYYSWTGTVYELAKYVAEGAQRAGAEVRLLKVRELAPEQVIAAKVGWAGRPGKAPDVPEATRDDVAWADGVIFGTPTRFGNVSSQLKQYLDSLGALWQQGRQSRARVPGAGRRRQ
jgi:NAD(P)H dehydrogenase (quinone)